MIIRGLMKRFFGPQSAPATSEAGSALATQSPRIQRRVRALLGEAKAGSPGGTDFEPRTREAQRFAFPAPRAVPSAAVVNGVLSLNTMPPYLIGDSLRSAMHFHRCANTPYQEFTTTTSITTPNTPVALQVDYTDFRTALFGGFVDIAYVPYILVKLTNGSLDPTADVSLELQADFADTEGGFGMIVRDDQPGTPAGSSVSIGPPPNSAFLSQRVRVQQIQSGVTVWVLFMPGRQLFSGTTIGRAYLTPLIVRRALEGDLTTPPGLVGEGAAGNTINFSQATGLTLFTTVNSAINNPVGVTVTFGTDAIAGLTTVARDILAGAMQAQVTSGQAYNPNEATVSLPGAGN